MSLDLDQRQRAMLAEMRVKLWWPPPAPAPPVPPADVLPIAARSPAAPLGPRAAPHPRPVVLHALQPGAATPSAPTGRLPTVQGLDMAALAAAIAGCAACALCDGRKAAVFPMQPYRQADWMVVGDPPTEDDERAAAAFAGQAGVLLDNMLRAVRRTRDGSGAHGVWLTHVVKCRPAVVRNPTPDELACCAQYLRREVALVQPRVILAMGRFAALSLLVATDPEVAKVPFGKLRGRLHRFEGVPVVVSYSPARLLRAQEDKAGAWADLCLAQATSTKLPPGGAPDS